ncbi:MAG TPA: PIN domain-containing protein [Terriglobia bacterium]|jgi:predicted nucleic acid-binding protein
MESAIRGLVLDSSVLVAAERAKLTTPQVLRNIRAAVPIVADVPIVVSALTVAEMAHGIYRANTPGRSQHRRQFVDELKAQIPVHSITQATAEIIARVGGEQAAKGITLPLADLIIGACALELGYAIGTDNRRDFDRIPDFRVISL